MASAGGTSFVARERIRLPVLSELAFNTKLLEPIQIDQDIAPNCCHCLAVFGSVKLERRR